MIHLAILEGVYVQYLDTYAYYKLFILSPILEEKGDGLEN